MLSGNCSAGCARTKRGGGEIDQGLEKRLEDVAPAGQTVPGWVALLSKGNQSFPGGVQRRGVNWLTKWRAHSALQL